MFNATDLTLTSHHILGKAQLSAGQISKADVNGDSTVDVADAVVMANWLNNKITIDVTPDTASWVLTGPAGFAAVSGSGDRLGSNAVKIAPTGSYYLHCAPVSGYISPLDSATSFTAGGTLDLKPWYSRLDMCGVQASAFTMGRTDAESTAADELPRHTVMLSPYEIGKYEVTVSQFCKVVNWAYTRHYLDTGYDLYVNRYLYARVGKDTVTVLGQNFQIDCVNNVFYPGYQDGRQLGSYPVYCVTWQGAVLFCNWLSEKEGLTPCYDLGTWTLKSPCPNGYRLPTEAEWERAAAWDGTRHRVYGMIADAVPDSSRCNFARKNPMGATSDPFPSPVGWFNGSNTSPKGSVKTVDSPSPVGCYDMSGNADEWCYDWYGAYDAAVQVNPTGPATGSYRIQRGGSWSTPKESIRTAYRGQSWFNAPYSSQGFRLVRSVQPVAYTAVVSPLAPDAVLPNGKVATTAFVSGPTTGTISYHWITRKPNGSDDDSGTRTVAMSGGCALVPPYDGFPTDAVGQYQVMLRVTAPVATESDAQRYSVAEIPAVYVALQSVATGRSP